MNGCCKNHDRLDQKLSQLEYYGMICGSEKHEHEFPHPSQGGVPQADADGNPKMKKVYCCEQCPTLIADIKAS